MARHKCPACGSPYDGKRCRACCYEPFTEEVAHGNHYHEGEPLVVKETTRLPRGISVERRGCKTYSGRKKSRLPKWLRIVLIILGISYGMDILFGVVGSFMIQDTMTDVFSGYAEVEPEPIVLPEGVTLFEENGILVIADWQDGGTCTGAIPVYVQNGSDQDVTVTSELLSVNGYMTDHSFLYCQADAGETAMDTLWIDDADLKDAGIETAARITFCLDIYDSDSYETLFLSDMVTLHAAGEESALLPPEEDGTALFEENGLKFVYTGCTDTNCAAGEARFYLENNTERCINFYINGANANGEYTDLCLWRELTPGAKAIAYMSLYPLEEMGISDAREVQELEFVLELSDRDDWDFWLQSDPLTLDLSREAA